MLPFPQSARDGRCVPCGRANVIGGRLSASGMKLSRSTRNTNVTLLCCARKPDPSVQGARGPRGRWPSKQTSWATLKEGAGDHPSFWRTIQNPGPKIQKEEEEENGADKEEQRTDLSWSRSGAG